MQTIISLSTWSQITGLNLKCIVNYVVFGLKLLSSSAQRLTVCCAFRFCKSLCCKPTVFVYTGCSIKRWVSHLFSFLNHSCQFVLSTLVCLKSWVREDVEKEGSSETDRKQDRAVTNEDSCQLGWRGSDVKQENNGGREWNLKQQEDFYTQTQTCRPPKLSLRDGDNQTPSPDQLLYASVTCRIASTHQHEEIPWPCPKCFLTFSVTLSRRN